MHQRTHIWVILHALGQSSSDRVLEDVTGNYLRQLVVPQHVFESVALPENAAMFFLVIEPGVLLCTRDKPLAVGCVGRSLSQQMHVVAHEAVRDYCKLVFSG